MNSNPATPALLRLRRRHPTLTVTAGPLSSGKSTWVRAFRHAPGNPLCLIRNEVRKAIGGAQYLLGPVTDDIEDAVTASIDTQARQALSQGRDVFIDGCNNHGLARAHWESLATECAASFRLMFFNLTLDELLALNSTRKTPRPRQKIEESHAMWAELFQRLPKRPQHKFVHGQKRRAA